MKPRTVLALAVVTGIAVVAAVISVTSQRPATSLSADRDHAFTGLADKVNDVAAIKVVSKGKTFTIKRTDKGWGMAENGGYPVSFEKAKTAIVGLSQLKLFERKTADPARYERLELRDPKDKEAKSKQVVLTDSGGKTLADGIVGRRNPSLFGESGGGTYLRRGAEKETWLAEGTVDIGATPNDWMIRDIVNLEAEIVKSVTIRQPDGATLSVHKADKTQKNFTVDGIPEGRKLKNANEGKEVAGGLWRLSLEDVKPASEKPLAEKLHRAEYVTYDGLKVAVDIAVKGEDYWGRFSASVDETVGDEKSRKEAAKKVKEINDRVTGWHYRLSVGEGERLTTKMKDLLAEDKPAKS